jgi:glutathione S-transferase
MLKIWGRATSSNVQKVLWCCTELDIPFERTDLGGPFGGNRTPEYLAMNPNGLVPTVQDGDLIMWESNTIQRYLCATRGGARLHPVDAGARTQVERWMDWQISTLNPSMSALLFGYYRTAPEQRDSTALEAARKRGGELWAIVDKHLEGRNFMAGDALTLADITLGIFVHRWHSFPIERPPLARLKAWYRRIAERPGFKTHVAIPIS